MLDEPTEPAAEQPPFSLRERLKEYFLTGILVLIPVVVTLWALLAVLGFVDSFFAWLPPKFHPYTYLPIPGLGLLMTALIVLVVGAASRNYLGRITYHYGDRFMSNVPVIRGIYKGVKQMLETVVANPTQNFRKVVLIEYPRKGSYTIAFLTGAARGEIQDITHKRVFNVFVPTTPNPTSGYMLILPEDELIPLKMSVEDAFKIIISGGMVNPGEGTEEAIGKHLPRPLPERIRNLDRKFDKKAS
jgi:uncharacterized membrane protein